MSMKSKILMGTTLLITAFSISETRATNCVRVPSCEQLGYTMTKADCGETSVLRCPFALSDDSQVFCRKEASVKQVVTLGAIIYGDGTVSPTLLSGKTPIGVVFDVENRLAVALTDVKKDGSEGSEPMLWSINYYDIPDLVNCESYWADSRCVDGRANTDKILACGSGCGGTPAASACNSYQPTGCTKDFCKQGKWFLPSLRDLHNIYQQKKLINALSSSLGKGLLTESSYWSSTESSHLFVWYLYMVNSTRAPAAVKDRDNYYVRPVVAF